MATLRALAVPSGPCANSLLSVLAGVLDGRDAPLVPVPAGNLRESQLLTSALRVGEPIDDDIALVVPTSGTTGTPKGAMLTAAALIAGASAQTSSLVTSARAPTLLLTTPKTNPIRPPATLPDL